MAVSIGNFGTKETPGVYRPALQELSRKLYLCHYKTPFRPSKGDLPTATHRGDYIAVSPCEMFPGNQQTSLSEYDETENQSIPATAHPRRSSFA